MMTDISRVFGIYQHMKAMTGNHTTTIKMTKTRGTLAVHRYCRRLAKGFESTLHLLVEDVSIDHSGGEV